MDVTKADGRLERFDSEKIMQTCLRAGVSEEDAAKVVSEVSERVYDKMPTRELLGIILKVLKKYSEPASLRYNLRQAIGDMDGDGAVFEVYVQKLLESYGYATQHATLVAGKCVEHEVDIIAKKDGRTIMVECKHHREFHTYTSMKVGLEVWAAFEDMNAGNKKFDEAWLVCNTKYSEHCIKYAACKGVTTIGWKYPPHRSAPPDMSLEAMVEDRKLYPVTLLQLKEDVKQRLFSAGIITIRDMLSQDITTLARNAGLKAPTLKVLVEKARIIERDNKQRG